MKLKKMRVIHREDYVDHHFKIGQEVLLIQDFYSEPRGNNTFYKVCLGERTDTGELGKQTLAETSLEFVEYVEYPDVDVVGFFIDVERVVAADLGNIVEVGLPEEAQAGILEEATEFFEERHGIMPETADELHLIVAPDDDGDFVYTVVMDYFLE